MRQRRWLELVKDYDIDIRYHPGKANKVTNALSRKSSSSLMSIQSLMEPLQKELVEAGIELITGSLAALTFQPTILDGMKERQEKDASLLRTKNEVLEGKESDFVISDEGILYRKRRLCIPNEEELKKQILKEAHETPYSVHPGATKMYQDMKQSFWWPKMKNDVATFVSKCLTCQKVNAEHQRPGGELQKISIPE